MPAAHRCLTLHWRSEGGIGRPPSRHSPTLSFSRLYCKQIGLCRELTSHHAIQIDPNAKGIIMDVYLKDDKGQDIIAPCPADQ